MNESDTYAQYGVLSPWADADPVPLSGITRRLGDLSDKKIGLFCNDKRAAKPTQVVVEKTLKERFPTCETTWYSSTRSNVPEVETENRGQFEEWLKELDGVIIAIGD